MIATSSNEAIADGLFFIVGTGRCGSTLLQSMLSSHSRMTIPAETRFFGQADPVSSGFHDPLRDGELVPYVKSRLADWWWKELGIADGELAATVQSGVRSSRSLYLWMLGRLARRSGKPRVGEKTPYYGSHAQELLTLFPQARFIHIHRDPRDVVASLRAQEWWVATSALSCAMVCYAALSHQSNLRERWPEDRLLTISYESLVERPRRELQRVCKFLDESFEDGMLQFHERIDPGFLEIERDWKQLTLRPLTRARLGRYRRELTDREIRLVEWCLGPLLTDYGYAPDPDAMQNSTWDSEFQVEKQQWLDERASDGPERCIDVQPILRRINARR